MDLTQIIKKPTHIKGGVLDVLLTRCVQNISDICVLDNDEICKSDHCPITFNIKAKVSRTKSTKREIYNFKKAEWSKLNESLHNVPWHGLLNDSNDIETNWHNFKTHLFKCIDTHIPKIKISSEFEPPWFDSDTFNLCREKERLRSVYKKTKSDDAYMKFSAKRREFKNLAQQKMRDNFDDINDPLSISKKFWSYVKSCSNSHRIPHNINYDNCHKTEPKEKAELFNEFFCDQFSEASKYNICIDKLNCPEFEIDFDIMEICNLLRNINPNKAHGPDGIHGKILKNCSATLSLPLKLLFKVSYNSGQIPNEWKLANVVPVHKKGAKSDVSNYRPISLTCLIMKQFENIIRKRIMEKCEHLINASQHGFLPHKSCTTQMVGFNDSLALAMNENKHTDVIYFDFAKAFDTVNHDILLDKLKNIFKLDGKLLRFIVNYLKDRKQQVVVGNCTSGQSDVSSGVPQGSIVGPLLFVLFINDITEGISEGTSISLYADDTKIWRIINNKQDNIALQNDINALQDWAAKNKMVFHPSKCHVLPISRRRLPDPARRHQYYLGVAPLEYCSAEKDLGVLVTSKLNYTDHCNKIYSKANGRLGLIKRTCHFVGNKDQKRKLYLVMVRSMFEHCSVVFRPHNQTTINKLENIQKRAIKWILNEQYNSYTDIEYFLRCKQLNFLPLDVKFKYNDLLLFHKIAYDLSPAKLPHYIHFFDGIHRLRSSHLDNHSLVSDVKPTVSAKYSKKSTDGVENKIFENTFFYRAHLSWNSLPCEIRQICDPITFKIALRNNLWNEALHKVLNEYKLLHCPTNSFT